MPIIIAEETRHLNGAFHSHDQALKARRERCARHLSAYIKENPKTVDPAVALRFLKFGHREADLQKFMADHARAAAVMQIPESIKEQARGIFRRWLDGYVARQKKRLSAVMRKKQRGARRTMRTAGGQ